MMLVTGANRKVKKKLLSIRLSSDGLSFWTTALFETSEEEQTEPQSDYNSESEEVFFPFDKSDDIEDNINRGFDKAMSTSDDIVRMDILLDTPKTILVPEKLFDELQIRDYIKLNNIGVNPDECIEVSDARSGVDKIKVITVFNRKAIDTTREVFGDRARLLSPFILAETISSKYYDSKQKGKRIKPPKKLRDISTKDCSFLYLSPSNVYITIQRIFDGELKYAEVLPYSSPADLVYYMQELATCFDIRKHPVYIKGIGSKTVMKMLRKIFKESVCG